VSRYLDGEKNEPNWWLIARDFCIGLVLLIVAMMAGCPVYRVWQQGQVGLAALKRAEQDRQIAVQEAMAKKESATLLAAAEVERRRGSPRPTRSSAIA
jgi:hypothetical protein